MLRSHAMMKQKQPKPTESELEILKILWAQGASSVREVYESLGGRGGYTTVLKFLQIMAEKKLVRRDESKRAHVYTAAVDEQAVKRDAVKGLAGKLFGGSGLRLAMQAIEDESVSTEELEEIRALLEARKPKRK